MADSAVASPVKLELMSDCVSHTMVVKLRKTLVVVDPTYEHTKSLRMLNRTSRWWIVVLRGLDDANAARKHINDVVWKAERRIQLSSLTTPSLTRRVLGWFDLRPSFLRFGLVHGSGHAALTVRQSLRRRWLAGPR
jgi:hypothetical protein